MTAAPAGNAWLPLWKKEYVGYLSREEQRVRTARVRSIVTDQFDGLAGTLTGLSEYSCGITPCGEGLTQRITEALLAVERELREVLCWTTTAGHLTVRLAFPAALLQRVDAERLRKIITTEAGLEMAGPARSQQNGALLLTYREKPCYTLGQWQVQLPAEGKRYLRRYTAAGKGRRGYTGAHSFRWDGHRRACCAG